MKKIAILTQPLHDNYGGLLQAYALKETLKFLGHSPLVVNRHGAGAHPFRRKLSKLKSTLLNRPVTPNQYLSDRERAVISEKTIGFRAQYIPELSKLITSQRGMNSLLTQNIDAYVVGSDQCWRPRYSPCISNYFLDFAKESKGIKRIAYAVSFGTAEWEFNDADTLECKNLLKLFDAISVREDDGVALVQNHLDRADAVHVLDPTMLLQTSAYDRITTEQKVPDSSGNLKVYVLDKNKEKEEFIRQAASRLQLETFEVMPERRVQQEKVTDANVELFKYPCPSQWLKGFQDAQFVITDSFHGTVFSILYNKPFIALGNERRGMSRFTSLLKMFGLQDRLVLDLKAGGATELLEQSVDWQQVNEILSREREKAMNFLKDNLEP
ncbi:polysaccharide pyruvyl transferase family protein [Pseudidiomarina donghaiensis]|uniref:Polysaccharide pyruvyl transferase family protein n=1 Tax=Pseudidiomarina donghaiensis TaxID=519452 RepID=A0A432XKU4_9GAMM|nr:polysaccharide pyruvyl transferase family protein [Pseudidiomarina donghaiensis]RUO49317.1 polysaccharide pyruvyl transferase family protein [Pseudidiomarina donghaiensis]SFV20979.1 Polysaccharide pyruvyl transferase [Pseudidiomarina donghaiensis]